MYKFKCNELGHEYPFGIEYSDDNDGLDVLHVQWYKTEQERDIAFLEDYE